MEIAVSSTAKNLHNRYYKIATCVLQHVYSHSILYLETNSFCLTVYISLNTETTIWRKVTPTCLSNEALNDLLNNISKPPAPSLSETVAGQRD